MLADDHAACRVERTGRLCVIMCGRFLISATPDAVAARFGLAAAPEIEPRWNLAPTQLAPVIRSSSHGIRSLDLLQWGLVPHWSKDPTIGNRMINARAETASEKPSYRVPLRKRRCLVPSNGFYEWKREGDRKQPYCIRAAEGTEHEGLIALAGLWECWQGGDEPLETFTILTTTPNSVVSPIHDRMPVIIQPKDYNLWLDPHNEEVESLASLLSPAPDDLLQAYPVSRHVNRPANDDASCIDPV